MEFPSTNSAPKIKGQIKALGSISVYTRAHVHSPSLTGWKFRGETSTTPGLGVCARYSVSDRSFDARLLLHTHTHTHGRGHLRCSEFSRLASCSATISAFPRGVLQFHFLRGAVFYRRTGQTSNYPWRKLLFCHVVNRAMYKPLEG